MHEVGRASSSGLAAGTPKTLALLACMRELPAILNAMIRTDDHWCAAYVDRVLYRA